MGTVVKSYIIKPFEEDKAEVEKHGLTIFRLVREFRKHVASFSEICIAFKSVDEIKSHVFLELFSRTRAEIKFRKIYFDKIILDSKKYSLLFFMVENYPSLSNYLFMKLKNKEETRWYYTTIGAFNKFINYLRKANLTGVELKSLVKDSEILRSVNVPE